MTKKHRKEPSFCDISGRKVTEKKSSNKCAFYKHEGGFEWKGVKDQPYKTKSGEWSKVIRRVLIGAHGESAKFHVRYFEISPGGNSSLERHMHEHVVLCLKGRGVVRTGKTKREMDFMDTLYIPPDTVHQMMNPFAEP